MKEYFTKHLKVLWAYGHPHCGGPNVNSSFNTYSITMTNYIS